MAKTHTVTASKAARSVGKLLRNVRQGDRIEITKYGRLIAVMKPIDDDKAE